MATKIISKTIKVEYTEQEMIRCVARVDMPEYGLKVGDVFYLARSSKNDGQYYVCRFDDRAASWFCGCPARKPCRHEKAAGAHSHARMLAQKAAKEPTPIVAKRGGGLNYANEGFSILKRSA